VSHPEPKKRTRDPEGKRAAITAAARAVFAEYGYEKSTIREIARRAGVTHGLVVLHFESKEKLFLAAVPGPSVLAASVSGDLQGLPERVARGFVDRMEFADIANPFIAVVRSAAGDQEAAGKLLRAMRASSLAAYQQVMTARDTPARVEMIGALLIGVTLSRYVLGAGPLATMPRDQLVEHLTRILQAIILD
jgi:DNA-binding transcriptional regulator YbjK